MDEKRADQIIVNLPLFEKLVTQATRDQMTGLLNRQAFDEIARQEMKYLIARGGKFSVLLMDIDHFKKVNDNMVTQKEIKLSGKLQRHF